MADVQKLKVMRPTKLMALCGFSTAIATLTGCGAESPSTPPVPVTEQLTVQVVATLPADRSSFTQGLEVDPENPDQLVVGTGGYGESRLYRRTLAGEVLATADFKPTEFGEGITQHGDKLWQLTWTNGVAYQRDATTLEVLRSASYPGEGWGLCSTGDSLIMSDGSNTLRVLDPETFAERKRIVTPVDKLNELECADGAVYANRFMTTEIVKISLSGDLLARIDASSLENRASPDLNNVLNGIAAVPGSDGHFYVTGKRWPDMYEVKFVPKES